MHFSHIFDKFFVQMHVSHHIVYESLLIFKLALDNAFRIV